MLNRKFICTILGACLIAAYSIPVLAAETEQAVPETANSTTESQSESNESSSELPENESSSSSPQETVTPSGSEGTESSSKPTSSEPTVEETKDEALSNDPGEKTPPNTDSPDGQSIPSEEDAEEVALLTLSRTEKESNNTRATANKMYVGDTMTGYINNQNDVDCFKIVVPITQKVTISMTGPSGKDYDIWLQDANGANLANSSKTGTSSEALDYSMTKNKVYIIAINSYSGYSTSSPYRLKVQGSKTSNEATVLNVSVQRQRGTYWCWAACAEAVAKKEGVTLTQETIIRFCEGGISNNIRDAGNVQDQVNALKNYGGSKFANARIVPIYGSADHDATVVDQVFANKPVSVACLKKNDTSRSMGHNVLVTGVNTVSEDMVIQDPWDKTSTYRLTRSKFYTEGFYTNSLTTYIIADYAVNY